MEARQQQSCIQFALGADTMIPDVNSVFSLQISARPTASYTVASPAYTAPPCLVPLTNRPSTHQRRSTKRLRMLCSPVTDILVSSRTASLLHAGRGEVHCNDRKAVGTCRTAPRIISWRVSIRPFRAVAVWFFYRACVFMCTRRRSLFTDCSVRPSRLFILLLFLVFIHKVKVDRRELHYCTEVIERRAIC